MSIEGSFADGLSAEDMKNLFQPRKSDKVFGQIESMKIGEWVSGMGTWHGDRSFWDLYNTPRQIEDIYNIAFCLEWKTMPGSARQYEKVENADLNGVCEDCPLNPNNFKRINSVTRVCTMARGLIYPDYSQQGSL